MTCNEIVQAHAMLNVFLSTAMLLIALGLAAGSMRRHLPWSLVAALVAAAVMAGTLVITGMGAAGYSFDGISTLTLVLRLAAILLLIAAFWAFIDSPVAEDC
jgi:hypothetical protein